MPDTKPVDLTGHVPRGSTTDGGGCLFAFGLPFMAAGLGAAWAVHLDPSTANVPLPAVYAFCGLFVLVGFGLSLHGIRTSVARWRRARIRRQYPNDPWRADYAWDPKGDRERPIAKAINGLFGLAVFAIFLAPFNVWMANDPNTVGVIILGIFDLLLVASIGFWLYDLGKGLKYGAGWVRYERFPYFLGDRLDVRLGFRGRLDKFEKVIVTLRFIKERPQTSGKSQSVLCRQTWAEVLEFDPRVLRGATDLPVSIELPTGEYTTRLSEAPAQYWEIELHGVAPGIDFQSRFLVPVYARG